MNPFSAVQVKEELLNHQVDLILVPDSGHHVYIDNLILFNKFLVNAAQGKLAEYSKNQYQELLEIYKSRNKMI